MTDSTLFYGAIDLLDGFYGAQVETSFGEWVSIQTETSSPFIDGAAVSGDATGNREITLAVQIKTDNRADLIAASEALIGEANKQANTLTWTFQDSEPMVYDTFRVRSPKRSDTDEEQFFVRTYELTIPALPFARSATLASPAVFPPADVTIGAMAGTGFLALTEESFGPLAGVPCPSASPTSIASGSAQTVFGGLTPVSNCSVTNSAGSRVDMTRTAGGSAAVAKAVTPVATSAAAVSIGSDVFSSSDMWQLGVEWFTGATSLYVDWGPVITTTIAPPQSGVRSIWAASVRPTAATHVGYRVRITAAATDGSGTFGGNLQAYAISLGSTDSALQIQSDMSTPFASHRRANVIPVVAAVAHQTAGWRYLTLPSSVNVSALTSVAAWLYRGVGTSDISRSAVRIKLHSASGKWSGWTYTPDAAENASFGAGAWRGISLGLSSPSDVSDSGAATLTAITAVSWEVLGNVDDPGTVFSPPFYVGDFTGGGLGSRGSVYLMDSIMGSAAAAASAHLWSTTALTDLVVATVDGLDGSPLLTITSSASAAAGGYKGVYSVLASRTDATAPTTPQLVVTQKQGATTVKSVTLSGKSRPGNHYVDFGTVPLPLVAVPDENVGVNYTFALTPTSANWGELLLLDVNSSLVILEQIDPARKNAWIDTPDSVVGIGDVWVGITDRTDASSPMQAVTQSSPFTVKAPNVKLLVYSTAAAPSASLSYYPHYLDGLA